MAEGSEGLDQSQLSLQNRIQSQKSRSQIWPNYSTQLPCSESNVQGTLSSSRCSFFAVNVMVLDRNTGIHLLAGGWVYPRLFGSEKTPNCSVIPVGKWCVFEPVPNCRGSAKSLCEHVNSVCLHVYWCHQKKAFTFALLRRLPRRFAILLRKMFC